MVPNDLDHTGSRYQRVGGRAALLGVLTLVLGSALAGWGGYLLHEGIRGSHGLAPDDRLPAMIVIIGSAVSVVGVLVSLGWYSGQKIGIQGVSRHRTALWVGAGWGVVAAALGSVLETWVARRPGGWGSSTLDSIMVGPVEEGLKLLVPVLLLIFSAAWRNPKLGFWVSFSAAAGFALMEGLSYVLGEVVTIVTSAAGDGSATHALQIATSTFGRSLADLAHPIYTASAAAVIWIAAWTLPKLKAIGVGIVAFIIAAALHSFQDWVFGGYVARVNLWLSAGLALVFVVMVFFIWFRPELSHLNQVVRDPEGSPRRS